MVARCCQPQQPTEPLGSRSCPPASLGSVKPDITQHPGAAVVAIGRHRAKVPCGWDSSQVWWHWGGWDMVTWPR